MKKIYTLIFLITTMHLRAQDKPTPTDVFIIQGEVKAGRQIGFADIEKLTVHPIGDVVITNHDTPLFFPGMRSLTLPLEKNYISLPLKTAYC